VAGGVALTVAVGLGAEARGHELGTPLPPFLAGFDPGAGSWTVPAVVVLGGALLAVRRWARQAPAAAFAGGALLLALALRLALGAARDGPAGWWAVFDTSFEAKNEYLPALPALDYGVGVFLDRFAEVGTSLPVHAVGHPPGLLVLMHGLGIESPEALAALVIGTGALSVPLVYLLGRRLLDERRARMAALLYLFAPSALVYGATSADALFVTAGLIAALGLSAGSRAVRATAGAGALAVASFFSWALLAIGAWAALLVWRREGPRAALALSAACAAALAAFYAALYAASGFDPLGALQ
jgi:hypothetical protein